MKTCRYKLFWIFILFLVSILFGCGSHGPLILRMYEGPSRPIEEKAKIHAFVQEFVEIDGVKTDIEKYQWHILEMLPGVHTMTVVRFGLDEQCTIHFTLEAGHYYWLTQWGNDIVLFDMMTNAFHLPKPSAREVIVRSPRYNSGLKLISVDGNSYSCPIEVTDNFLVHLSPGRHKFHISIKTDYAMSDPSGVEISGYLEAGCTYIIKPNDDFHTLQWHPELVKVKQ